ncbi:MAG: hypothetical protein L6427_11750 [Actinomycetia bacterium]|nr:hypothetical protein [Actinomycetes bacterium]
MVKDTSKKNGRPGSVPRLSGVRIRRPLLVSASLLGALVTGNILLGIGFRNALLFAAFAFVSIYAVLVALWDEVDGKEAIREAIDPAGRARIAVTGGALLALSLLGANMRSGPYDLPIPLVDYGWAWLPMVFCVTGAILISVPVVTIKSEKLAIDMKANASYIVFFPSFLGYLVVTIFTHLHSGAAQLDGFKQWLLLISLSSGAVLVLAEAAGARRRRKPG